MFYKFALPKFEDQKDQRRANILAVTQLAAAVMIFSILIVSLILTPTHSEVLLQSVVGVVVMLYSFSLLRRGKLHLSAWIVVVLGWLVLTLDLVFISGIRGVNTLGQILVIILAGLVINGRSALVIALITIGADFGVLQLELSGILASPTPLGSNFARWFILSIYISLGAIYIWRADEILNEALRKTSENADRFKALFERTTDLVVVFDSDWKALLVNPQITELLGYTRDEVVGRHFYPELYSRNPQELIEYQSQALGGKEFPNFEHILLRKDGSEIPVELSITIVPDESGTPCNIQCVVRDITARKANEKQLRYQALHDPLTNLPNRAFLEEYYATAARDQNTPEDPAALLFLDLDDFKLINDKFGHAVGDQVLIGVSYRLQMTLRSTDKIIRMGGDEFVIILENATNKENVGRVARKIVEALSEPFLIDGQSIELTASIGIHIVDRKDLTEKESISASDIAMYRVKREGKNNFGFYDAQGESSQPGVPDSEGDRG